MSKIQTLYKTIRNNPQELSRMIDAFLSRQRLMKHLPDSIYLKMRYALCIHKRLNLSNPVSFNEKLQWLKLYYQDPLYEMLADKYMVKEYVKRYSPELKVIPTIGVWEKAEEIDFNKLPEQFVIKCTHDTGSTVICKNKKEFDTEETRRALHEALSRNMFYRGREWVYKEIKPRIIAEPYLSDHETDELNDYKFMCFNGEVKCVFVCSDRFSPEGLHVTFFDREWEIMPFMRHYPKKEEGIPRPNNLNEMIALAEKMSAKMPFVRIDFYSIRDEIFFGEYTFFPGSGFEEFSPDEWDATLGNWITLPQKRIMTKDYRASNCSEMHNNNQ